MLQIKESLKHTSMPRTLTNKYNLPDTLYQAISYDTHKLAGDISVTTLLDAPQIRLLKRKHQYEEDVVDSLYALMGTALHHILERANIKSSRKRAFIATAETIMQEADKQAASNSTEAADTLRRGANWIFSLIPVLFPEIGDRYIYEITMQLQVGDKVLSGTFDLYDKETGVLYDYKFCSTFSWTTPESRVKWERQTNIYAHMLKSQFGYTITAIRIVAFFRDWNRYGFIKNKDYPDRQIKEISVPVYSSEDVFKYIVNRMDIHNKADNGDIPECSGEERWAKADGFAVKQGSVKRAVRVFDDKIAAETFIIENKNSYEIPGGKGKLWIEVRVGGSRRCEEFCQVAQFCEQRKRELEKIANYSN